MKLSLPATLSAKAPQPSNPQPPAKDMIAVIRTTPNRIKYCGGTVDALIASNDPDEHSIIIQCSNKTPNENGLAALKKGIEHSGGNPFIFLEDDVRFIKRFTRAARDFTNACAGVYSPVLPLGANYTAALNACRGIAWRCRTAAFYGTQAFVMRPADAENFIRWCNARGMPAAGFDTLLKEWAESKGVPFFLTPQKSFVQHIGVESSLHHNSFFHFATWPGRDWEFRTGAFSMEEQRSRPCDKALAAKVAEWFTGTQVAYDFGCSTGNYVRELNDRGLFAKGFDATPGLQSDVIEELDLARPQIFPEPPGNVLCLEVAEHIHPQDERTFLENVEALCGFRLVLSWATKGQGGKRHVNEQNAEYVIPTIEQAGFKYCHNVTQALRTAASIEWFKRTIYAFEKTPRRTM